MAVEGTERAGLQILPCTASQLHSAAEEDDAFRICTHEVNQVSIVGVMRRCVPLGMSLQYTVDDMSGPLMDVKQWVNTEDSETLSSLACTGRYVRVVGSLRSIKGQRSLLANCVRCIEDLNEITSHMLEVVQAHMQLFGKKHETCSQSPTDSILVTVWNTKQSNEELSFFGFSSIQSQVLNAIKMCRLHEGIGFNDLRTTLGYLSFTDIRKSLEVLLNEGHIFSTADDHHFKSTDGSA